MCFANPYSAEDGLAGTDPTRHVRDFLVCVKSRKKPAANAAVTRYGHIVSHAASIAWRLGRKVKSDAFEEVFIDDNEANRKTSLISGGSSPGWMRRPRDSPHKSGTSLLVISPDLKTAGPISDQIGFAQDLRDDGEHRPDFPAMVPA